MAKLVILGTSNAVPSQNHENTHMALVGDRHVVLIDSMGNPVLRLPQAGIALENVTDLILTHFHPDHVSSVPLLLMDMWLLGRKSPLDIYGLQPTLDKLKSLMEFYEWGNWPNFFPVDFHPLAAKEMTPVLENEEFRIYATPVQHLVPTIGLRIELAEKEKVIAYSCDTRPCQQVVELASGADLLIHEASGATPGHSSATQAGEIAREAEAGALMLIHYPSHDFDPCQLIPQAQQAFPGPVSLAQDFQVIDL